MLTEAVSGTQALPPAGIPSGPPFFGLSSDEALSTLLASAGFETIDVRSLLFTHRLSGAEELWSGLVDGTVRTAALVAGQREKMRRSIRTVFDRLITGYSVAGRLEIPVTVKVASGRKARV